MSRAFIKEDSGDEVPPERRQPSGPNYATPRGLDLIRKKVESLESAGAEKTPEGLRELRYWRVRLASVVLVDNAKNPPPDIRFGAWVETREADGKTVRRRIVGQDEAEGNAGAISWDSALGLALIGHSAGDAISWSDGDADRESAVIAFGYAAAA